VPLSELELQEKKEIELTPRQALDKALREGNFETDALEPGVILEIPQPRNPDQTMGSAPGEPWGVNQELRAIVRTGQEDYFVIDASIRLKSIQSNCRKCIDSTIIARLNPDGTSSLVDCSIRDNFDDTLYKKLRARLGRPGVDVTIAQDAEGTVGVVDGGSMAPIKVFRQNPDEPTPLEIKGSPVWYVDPQPLTRQARHCVGKYF
jgi:hypothetical protein